MCVCVLALSAGVWRDGGESSRALETLSAPPGAHADGEDGALEGSEHRVAHHWANLGPQSPFSALGHPNVLVSGPHSAETTSCREEAWKMSEARCGLELCVLFDGDTVLRG